MHVQFTSPISEKAPAPLMSLPVTSLAIWGEPLCAHRYPICTKTLHILPVLSSGAVSRKCPQSWSYLPSFFLSGPKVCEPLSYVQFVQGLILFLSSLGNSNPASTPTPSSLLSWLWVVVGPPRALPLEPPPQLGRLRTATTVVKEATFA